MGRNKSNIAHKYFSYNAVTDTSTCTLCQIKIKGNHGTNLKKHLASSHDKEYKKSLIKYCDVEKETQESQMKQVMLSELKDLKKLKVNLSMEDLIDAAVEMVTVNGRPFSCIDDSGLRKIIDPILEGIRPGERKAINGSTVKQYLTEEAEKVRAEISHEVEGKCVSLKVDAATRLNRSFLGINLQYIHDGFLKLRTVGLVEIKEAHTGVFLQQTILNVLDTFHINIDQIYTITTDNGANMVKAVSLLEDMSTEGDEPNELSDTEESLEEKESATTDELLADIENEPEENDAPIFSLKGIRCVAHTFQLCVIDFLKQKENDRLLNKVRSLVRKLRNPTYLYILKKENFIAPILDCLTRWHSTVDMLLRLIEIKTIIANLIDSDPKLKSYKLSAYDWEQIRETIEILMPPKICTKRLQSEQLTLTDFYGAWLTCKMQVELKTKTNNSATILYRNMCRREDKILNTDVLLGALFLDPRFNIMLSEMQRIRAVNHLSVVYSHIQELKTKQDKCPITTTPQLQMSSLSDEGGDEVLETFLKSISTDKEVASHNSQATSNFGKIECMLANFYVQQERLSHKVDILNYWKNKKTTLPELYQLSEVVFAVPATQTSVERLFSGLKFLLSAYRTNITGKILENQILVRTNRIFDKRLPKVRVEFDLTLSAVDDNNPDDDVTKSLDLESNSAVESDSSLDLEPGTSTAPKRKAVDMQKEKEFMSKFIKKK